MRGRSWLCRHLHIPRLGGGGIEYFVIHSIWDGWRMGAEDLLGMQRTGALYSAEMGLVVDAVLLACLYCFAVMLGTVCIIMMFAEKDQY